MVELQVTSDYYNQDATNGKAKHSEKEGKARILPKIPSSKEEYNKTIFEVSTFAASREQAKFISDNWKENAVDIYPNIINLLTKPNKN